MADSTTRLPASQPRLVLGMGMAQMLGWASSYYLPAMLAQPMARDLNLAPSMVFAAFSWALVVSALMGPPAGWAMDRFGGRPVLALASLGFATGLGLLSLAQGPALLFLAWTLIGMAMAAGLYESAFAALVQLYGSQARRPITGITLMGGLASTVGWPLTAWLEIEYGWRSACLAWAGLHLLIGLPVHALLLGGSARPAEASNNAAPAEPEPAAGGYLAPRQHAYAATLLATIFALTWFISTAMAAHLPALLQASGLSLASALLLASLVGPAQVAGRVAEYGLLRRVHPLLSARLAGAMHPVGAVVMLLAGAPAGALFTVMHGAGNGILTIAKGTLPLVLFGTQGYGLRQGLLMVPARFAQALAPFAFGLALERFGAQALWFSAGLGALCLTALLMLPSAEQSQKPGAA